MMSIIPDSLKHRSLNKPLDPFYRLVVTIKIHRLPLDKLLRIESNTRMMLAENARFKTEQAFVNVETLDRMLIKRITSLEHKDKLYREKYHLVSVEVDSMVHSVTYTIRYIDFKKNMKINIYQSPSNLNYVVITVYGGEFNDVVLTINDHYVDHLFDELNTIRDESDVRRVIMKYFMMCFKEQYIEILKNTVGRVIV